jgi:hypothetical protein
MDYFPGDYYDQRCRSGKKLGDVFNDYLDFMKGVAYDTSKITWILNNFATSKKIPVLGVSHATGFQQMSYIS